MKTRKLLITIFGLLIISALLAACAPAAAPAMEEKPAAEEAVPAEEAAPAEKLYIPVISKGFQHAFWLAVEKGAEQAAADYGVTITFEGPETEAMVDKQMDMLQAAIDKNPAGICFAAVDSKAAIPLLEQAQAKGIQPDRHGPAATDPGCQRRADGGAHSRLHPARTVGRTGRHCPQRGLPVQPGGGVDYG